MMNEMRFKQAEKIKRAKTKKQEKLIKEFYEDLSKDISKKIPKIDKRSNISSIMRKQWLDKLKKEVDSEIANFHKGLEKQITLNMMEVANATVSNAVSEMDKLGITTLKTSFFRLPNDIIENVISGNLYKDKWTLSKAIWGTNKKVLSDIDKVITLGIAENKSTLEIAQDLEKYVNPKKATPWDWSKVYPNTNKVIDYNAQRLSRTMVSHAYQASFEKVNYDNPFVLGYRWLTSNSHRTCEVCVERSEHDEGLGEGVYNKSGLPLDHPNGMCTFSAVLEEDNKIQDSIAAWYKGEPNAELDEFIDSIY